MSSKTRTLRSPDFFRGASLDETSAPNFLSTLEATCLKPVKDSACDVARLTQAIKDFAGAFGMTPRYSDADIQALLSTQKPRSVWPAFYWLDEEKSGFVGLVEFQNYIEIKSIFVFEEARRSGLALNTVKTIEQVAKTKDKQVFALASSGDGDAEIASRAFWKSAGQILSPAKVYFYEPTADTSATDHLEGCQVYEFEDASWQTDWGLVTNPEHLPESVSQVGGYVSFVTTELWHDDLRWNHRDCYLFKSD